MGCPLTLSAYKRGCATPSGIKSLYIIDKSEADASDVVFSVAAGTLSFTAGGSPITAYKIEPVFNTATVTTAITSDAMSNAFKYDRSLEFKLDGYSADLSVLVENIVKGRTSVLVEWVNGTYTYLGNERGLSVTGGDAGTTATNMNDPKGITLTLTEEATSPMPIVDYANFETAFDIVLPA